MFECSRYVARDSGNLDLTVAFTMRLEGTTPRELKGLKVQASTHSLTAHKILHRENCSSAMGC